MPESRNYRNCGQQEAWRTDYREEKKSQETKSIDLHGGEEQALKLTENDEEIPFRFWEEL